MNRINRKLFFIGIFFSTVTLLSCNGALNHKGSMVQPDRRIPLVQGEHQSGRFESQDLSLDYNYKTESNTMTMSGTIIFANQIIYNFSTIDRFRLRVMMLDASGRVIDEKGIYNTGHRVNLEKASFQRVVDLPMGTKQIAFSYSGSALEGGSEGSTPTRFWELPLMR